MGTHAVIQLEGVRGSSILRSSNSGYPLIILGVIAQWILDKGASKDLQFSRALALLKEANSIHLSRKGIDPFEGRLIEDSTSDGPFAHLYRHPKECWRYTVNLDTNVIAIKCNTNNFDEREKYLMDDPEGLFQFLKKGTVSRDEADLLGILTQLFDAGFRLEKSP